MNILGIIPARAGSKRLPGKNLRQLGGRPLVRHAIDLATECPSLTAIVVPSDDEGVLELAARDRRVSVLRRPAELATDIAPAIDYVRHALMAMEAEQVQYDAIVILQPTSPLTLPADVEGTIRLLADSGADSAVSIVRVDHALHPAKFKVLAGDRLLPYFEDERGRMAAHELPPVYVRNGSVYAVRRTTVEAGELIGPDCRGFEMPLERSIDINDELDFAFCEFLWARTARALR